jgi:LPS sulfotransferase NodH
MRTTKPTSLELQQLLAAIEQANSEIITAIRGRFNSQYATTNRHTDDRVKSAIRAHRAAVAMVWQPSPDGISAARPQRDQIEAADAQ